MGYSQEELKGKIKEFYPEIDKHGLETSLSFDDNKNAYIVKLQKGEHALTTHLEKADADSCMEGQKCVYLGVQIGQFAKNFEEEE